MEGHFLREDHAAYVGPITPGAVSGPDQETIIAKREALWRSRPAGLDCRARTGLAMTGQEEGDHPSALARLQAELDRALERLDDLGEQTEGFVGRVFGAERPTREDDAVDRPAPHAHRLAATGLLIHQALTRVERAVARLGEIA